MQKKTTLYLIGGIIGALIIALFVFFFILPKTGVLPGPVDTNPNNPNRPTRPTNPDRPTSTSTNPNATTTPPLVDEPIPLPRLRQISQNAVAGYVTYERTVPDPTKKGAKLTENVVRYTEVTKGQTYETQTGDAAVLKLTSTDIPVVQEAVWSPKGDVVYLRYVADGSETIQTVYGKLIQKARATSSTDGVSFASYDIKSTFLPQDIDELYTASGNSIFYITKAGDKGSAVFAQADGSKKTQIFSSPLAEWSGSLPKDSLATILSKPTYLLPGNFYTLNTSTGRLDKIIGGFAGLTALISPDNNQVLYAYSRNTVIETALYSIPTAQSSKLSLTTMPEKCVWSKKEKDVLYCAVPNQIPSGFYPDDWYQGVASFSDKLYRINTKTGTQTEIANPTSLVNQKIDSIDLKLDTQENFLLFKNKKDGSLWSLKLN